MSALRAHGEGNAGVAEWGCEALYFLASSNPTNKQAMISAGAIPLAEAAKRAHPSNIGVQIWTSRLLSQLQP